MSEVVMNHSAVPAVDATINIVLGGLLISFPRPIVDVLGVAASQSAFYSSILGGVPVGIGIALIIQVDRCERPDELGLGGAVAINFCGRFLIAAWLRLGDLDTPVPGHICLWSVVAVRAGVSLVELTMQRTWVGHEGQPR